MTLADAIREVNATIDAVAFDALTNGELVMNTAMPTSSHVSEAAKWVRKSDAQNWQPTLAAEICKMSAVHLDAAARATHTPKLTIEDAVIVILGRRAAVRMFGMTAADINPGEAATLTVNEEAYAVHADHEGAVEMALRTYSQFATRLVGLAWYNALSFELYNHHHLPVKSKKLAHTTLALLGFKDYFERNVATDSESVVMHDMFHPLSYHLKAKLARNREWGRALINLSFGNLAKRIPVKAADCGLAFNYPTLYETADTFSRNPGDLPAEVAPPAELHASLALYAATTDVHTAANAAAELRAMSPHFAIASAYLAGFIVGKIRRSRNDRELGLADLRNEITILGSPALARAASENAGAFELGITRGHAAVGGLFSDDRVQHTFRRVRDAAGAAVVARGRVVDARNAAANAGRAAAAAGAGVVI